MLPVKPVMIVFATALLTACASSGPAPSFEDTMEVYEGLFDVEEPLLERTRSPVSGSLKQDSATVLPPTPPPPKNF